jgi:hypothetical protein
MKYSARKYAACQMQRAALSMLCLGTLLLLASPLSADLVIVPSSATTQEGSQAGTFGINAGLTSQELYMPADMPGLNVGDQITGIHLRLNSGTSSYPTTAVTWSRFDIAAGIGQSSLSPTFANNFVATPTTVRTGSLAMDTGFFPGTGAPRDWSALISFDSPYTYTGGNLLLEVRTISPSQQLLIDTMGVGQTTGQSIFALADANATTASTGVFSLNWPIGFEVTAVPEPRAYLMLGVVALIIFVFRATRELKTAACMI